ncbi:hypothetical protein DMC14_000930 [Metamycoplasma phocicerebrale]|uniref:Lipoprotein-associated type-17 domain-containing protein n=1 Tax=Metamycoplasma phocicerebrale TaxID=142649 RepID=A0A3T0TTE4_9BACT|nr:hypothetical protein [Metamycoplasma phocicerebrale]AZZ65357.1 hypothetical protein DMC14_000930 [Metamycoplasma phocicerebrale]
MKKNTKKLLYFSIVPGLAAISAGLVTSCTKESKEKVFSGLKLKYDNIQETEIEDFDPLLIQFEGLKNWSYKIVKKEIIEKENKIKLWIKAQNGSVTYQIEKEITGFKLVTLTEEEIKEKVIIHYPYISKKQVFDFKKEELSIVAPRKVSVKVKDFEIISANKIKVNLEATSQNKTYTFERFLEGFKIVTLTKEEVEEQTKLEYSNVENTEIQNFDSKKIKINTPKGWTATIEGTYSEANSVTVSLKIKQFDVEYDVEKTITGFKNNQNIENDANIEIKFKEATISIDDLQNHYATNDITFSVTSKSSNFEYSVYVKEIDKLEGKIIIEITQKNKDTGDDIGVIIKEITGFKKQLPLDENDVEITISNLSKDQYSTKNVEDIEENEIVLNSKSTKYKYELRSIQTTKSDEGILMLNIKVLNAKDNSLVYTNLIKEITGFKTTYSVEESDLNIKFVYLNLFTNKAQPSDYAKFYAIQAGRENHHVFPMSIKNKFKYEIVSVTYDELGGTVSIKVKQKRGFKKIGEFTKTITGFKTGKPSEWTQSDVNSKITINYKGDIANTKIKDAQKDNIEFITNEPFTFKITKFEKLENTKTLKIEVEVSIEGISQKWTLQKEFNGFQ